MDERTKNNMAHVQLHRTFVAECGDLWFIDMRITLPLSGRVDERTSDPRYNSLEELNASPDELTAQVCNHPPVSPVDRIIDSSSRESDIFVIASTGKKSLMGMK